MLRAIILVLSFIPSVYAQQAGHEPAVDKARTVTGGAGKGVKACHTDIDRWCKNVIPGKGRLGACLLPHEKELSKRCRRWAGHGGEAHRTEAFLRDIDGAPAPAPVSAP